MSEPAPEQTPMDRLRTVGLLPDLPRDELRQLVADAVHEVQERLDKLEAEQRAWRHRYTPRRRRERP
jgi:hypothetical protein